MYGGTGDDSIEGSNDTELLTGGTGADTIDALAGDDLIDGDQGDDIPQGGPDRTAASAEKAPTPPPTAR